MSGFRAKKGVLQHSIYSTSTPNLYLPKVFTVNFSESDKKDEGGLRRRNKGQKIGVELADSRKIHNIQSLQATQLAILANPHLNAQRNTDLVCS